MVTIKTLEKCGDWVKPDYLDEGKQPLRELLSKQEIREAAGEIEEKITICTKKIAAMQDQLQELQDLQVRVLDELVPDLDESFFYLDEYGFYKGLEEVKHEGF